MTYIKEDYDSLLEYLHFYFEPKDKNIADKISSVRRGVYATYDEYLYELLLLLRKLRTYELIDDERTMEQILSVEDELEKIVII